MPLIAAFMWSKSPQNSISTLIYNDLDGTIISQPEIFHLPLGYFNFRKESSEIIKTFFVKLIELSQKTHLPIILEYRILFNSSYLSYLFPTQKSQFVYKKFLINAKKTKKILSSFKIKPQLRSRLKGRALILFKRKLRSMHLVSRKKDTNFEYHLWSVALHATTTTYESKLEELKEKLFNKQWNKIS